MTQKSSAVGLIILAFALVFNGTGVATDSYALGNNVQESSPHAILPEMVNSLGLNLDLLGQIGGSIDAVAVQGDYAYLGVGPRLVIIDISNPQQPVMLGQTNTLQEIVEFVFVAGNYAYVAGGYYMGIIDVNQPSTPFEVSHLGTLGDYVTNMALAGDYVYLATYDDYYLFPNPYVHIIDVSTAIPAIVGTIYPGYDIRAIAVSGNYAYIANYYGLEIFDVTQPDHPSEVGTFAILNGADAIALEGIYAYVIDRNGNLHIVDADLPSTPEEVGFFELSGYQIRGITVLGDLAYLYGENLHIVDVSIPSMPVEAGSYEIIACDTVISANYAYISNCEDSLRIIDVILPSSPIQVGSYDINAPGYARDVAVAGKYAYVTTNNGVHIVDVSISGLPVRAGYFSTTGPVDDITVFGNYAYISDYDDGIYILDISLPGNPIETSFYDTPGYVGNVAVDGSYAYIAQYNDGLHILDVSQPSNPTEVGFIDLVARRVTVKGDIAYVITGIWPFTNILFIDVSTPSLPVIVGSYSTQLGDRDLTVIGNYAYILSDGLTCTHYDCSRLSIIDITSLSDPFEVGSYFEYQAYYRLAVLGDIAFLAGDFIRVVNTGAQKDYPREIGYYSTPDTAIGIDGVDDQIYVADGKGGVYILRYNPPRVYLPLLQRNP